MMMQRTVRFGIIGGGLMGREFASATARWMHLLDMPVKPEIVAVSDPSTDAISWFEAHLPHASRYFNFQDLLSNPNVDAVYCAVPHHLHEEVYVAALRAGKHLFAEKPFGIDLAAAERIVRECRSHPDLLVRCSSEFPFYPAAQRIATMLQRNEFGKLIEWRSGFLHSSDLDPNKPINWKRRIATNGEYGCMGDLGLHVVHLPLRFGLTPETVHALLSKVHPQRPDGHGGMAACETWDNAVLSCSGPQGLPMVFEIKRISPGDTNSWYLKVQGVEACAEFNTKNPNTLRTLRFTSGRPQGWLEEDVKYSPQFPCITGAVFEFGFTDSILQMWAAYLSELVGQTPVFRCATPEEALVSHRLFSAALESGRSRSVVTVDA